MSNYWKKVLDEWEENHKSTPSKKTTSPNLKKTASSDYWGNVLADWEESNKKKKQQENIAPVKTTTKKEEDRKWFDTGLFDDGWQWGDLTKTIIGSKADVGENFGTGIIGMGERIVDAGATLGALMNRGNMMQAAQDEMIFNTLSGTKSEGVLDRYQGYQKQVEDETAKFVAKDLYDEEKIAKAIITNPVEKITGINVEDASVFGEKSDSLVQSAGQLVATAGLQAVGVPWWLTTGATTFGSEAENAFKNDATFDEAVLSSAITAGAEILSEKITGGISFGAKTFVPDELLAKHLGRTISSKTARTLIKLGVDAAGEGFEEVLSGALSAIGQKLTYDEDKDISAKELLFSEEALESFIGGAVLGGFSSGKKAFDSKSEGVDYGTGLKNSEKAVIDKVYQDTIAKEEADGKKLTNNDKSKIYDKVMNDFEKGYITTDTIEEVLGGETYKTYKDTINSEDAQIKELEDQIKELEAAQNTVGNAKKYDALTAQLEDLKANSQRDQLKSQLSDEVFNIAKDSRLVESYNEQSRRGQSFEADLSKYDTKQQAVVQKAIDSGILNNTNRTHEFVDMIAKISADKGVSFDFTNNARLKESGFAVDNATVNGYVTKDGITLNIDSSKSTRSVAGHEITHILEGTELYTELQNTIFEYAKSKGEYDSRLKALTELYKNVEDADVNAELTADLVGDYLFDDVDFINNLSAKHRNVFEKIYDEIKYLCRVATAGSKEARELEKVRKAFEDAYRADSQASGDIKYSLSRNNELMNDAEAFNDEHFGIDLATSRNQRQQIYDFMMQNADRLKLPEDIEGNTAIKNSSYDITEENTTVCIRSMAADALCDAVAENLGRPLTVQETLTISQELMNYTDEPECVYCYVATDRRAYREFLGSYYEQMQSTIEAIKSGRSAEEVYREFLDGRKDTKNMRNRFSMWQKLAEGGKMMSAKDLASEKNMQEAMRDPELAAQIKDARAYAQSASWAKKRVGYQAYDGHILKWSQRRVNDLNKHYGLRFYSFSDFSPAFVLENMQQMTDAAARGLKGLAYTKVLDFAEIFAPTGVNINVSVFGYNQNGTIAQDGMMGADWNGAKALRDKYNNVGITFVATNDAQIEWALDQDWIDVVVPYHLVRTGQAVAKHFGYTNYTAESADTKGKDWKKGDKKTIYPSEHRNDKATYLAEIQKANLEPRFARWVDHPNYMKLVNETRRPANETPPMRAEFNVDAAIGSLNRMMAQGGYFVPIGGDYANMQDIAGDIADTIRGQNQFSLSSVGETHRYAPGDGPMRDLALKAEDVAPVQDSVQDVAPVSETAIPDGYVSATEEDAAAVREDSFGSITDADAPVETQAQVYSDEPLTADDPLTDRDWESVGKRSVKAYMHENPDVKPFFQSEAEAMIGDLYNTTKGERLYNDDLYYRTGGEQGWMGVKRQTSEAIAALLDSGYTYEQIEKGLNAIIEDNGAENNALSKRIEFFLDERLRKGYTDFATGYEVPPNQDYINLLAEKQHNEAAATDFATITDADAPMEDIAPVVESVAQPVVEAPIAEQYEAIQPKPTKEPRMARATPAEQAQAQILTEEPKVDKKKGKLWSKIKNNIIDKGTVFETLSLKTGNRELQARWHMRRNADAKAQRYMEKELKPLIEKVEKSGKTKSFYEYLYHMHNIDRMSLSDRFDDAENKPVFGDSVTADVSRKTAAQLEKANPQFKQWAEEVYAYNRQNREMLVEGNIISREVANLWEEMYPHYVPIRRDGDFGLNVNVPLDTGRTGVNAPIKRATGGSSDILPLFDTMGQRTLQTYKAIANNRFGVELKNTLGTAIDSDDVTVDEAIDSVDTQDGLLQEGKDGRSPTFTVFENGEKVTFEITEEMYDAMKPTSEGMAATIKPLNAISNFRRNVITQYNPWFLLKNAVKDVQDVFINSQHPLRTYAAIPKAISQMATNGHYNQEYLENGGENASLFDNETNTFKEENKALEIIKTVTGLNAIAKANDIIERVPRMAEYIASREAGRSVDVSMLDAARVTTNFAAGGDVTKFLNRNGFTFLNASVQGAVQQVRNVREAKYAGLKGVIGLAAKTMAVGLPVLILNHLMWDDDEEYEELSDYVKQNYYIVSKRDDGQFVRIPRGRMASVIQYGFKQMENLVTGDDEVDFKTFIELVANNIAPSNPAENNIIAPIADVLQNKTWYGEDLVPTRLQDVPAAEQYDESTDSVSRWLGEATNTSPYKWNYLLDQYSGVIGDTFLPMMTPEAETGNNTFGGNLIAPLKDMFTTDSVMNNQNVSDFYDTVDELTTNANSSKATDEDVLKSKYINSVSADIGKLYGQKREIQNSNLPDDEKYNKVREIQRQIDKMAAESLNEYSSVNITGKYATVGDKHYRWYEPGEDSESEPGWQKISGKQLEKQEAVTSGLGISAADYWSNKEEYDYAYEYPEKYAVAKSVGGYQAFKNYSSDLYDIKADKDSEGKSISGSRKNKVAEYINNLDAEYGEKIILFKSEYTADDTYNMEIIEYLNGRDDISYEEMESILKELGFTVHADGRVTW